jgi:hypothetical protein
VSLGRRAVESAGVVLVQAICVCPTADEPQHGGMLATGRGLMQRCLAEEVSGAMVGAQGDQQLDCLGVPAARGNVERGSSVRSWISPLHVCPCPHSLDDVRYKPQARGLKEQDVTVFADARIPLDPRHRCDGAVVVCAPLGIGKDCVGVVDSLEELCVRVQLGGVLVGMQLARELAIRGLDLSSLGCMV